MSKWPPHARLLDWVLRLVSEPWGRADVQNDGMLVKRTSDTTSLARDKTFNKHLNAKLVYMSYYMYINIKLNTVPNETFLLDHINSIRSDSKQDRERFPN